LCNASLNTDKKTCHLNSSGIRVSKIKRMMAEDLNLPRENLNIQIGNKNLGAKVLIRSRWWLMTLVDKIRFQGS